MTFSSLSFLPDKDDEFTVSASGVVPLLRVSTCPRVSYQLILVFLLCIKWVEFQLLPNLLMNLKSSPQSGIIHQQDVIYANIPPKGAVSG